MNTSQTPALSFFAKKAQVALDIIQQGRGSAISGWLDFGAAVNDARAHFSRCHEGYSEYRAWALNFTVDGRKNKNITSKELSAAMWAAANPDQFQSALDLGGAHTVKGIYGNWRKLEKQKAQRMIDAGYGPPDVTRAEELYKVFTYCPDQGKLFWQKRFPHYFRENPEIAHTICTTFNRTMVGREALIDISSNGYKAGKVFGKHLLAHRVLYALHYGEWPIYIDHINGNRLDNRISNLRSVTMHENNKNTGLRPNNKSGISGVHWCKKAKKWRGIIKVNKRSIHLGFFESLEEARPAIAEARKKYDFHKNHGIKR